MKRTRKLLAAALAAVLALTILSGCSQTENIYNTIVLQYHRHACRRAGPHDGLLCESHK